MRTVMDGNAFYEIDEECLERMKGKRRIADGNEAAKDTASSGTSGLPGNAGKSGNARGIQQKRRK